MNDQPSPAPQDDKVAFALGVLLFLGVVAIINAEINLVIATEHTFRKRFLYSASFVLIAFGISWVLGALWNLTSRPWRPPAVETLVTGVVVLIGLSIHGSWRNGEMPSLAAIAHVRQASIARASARSDALALGLKPYYGEIISPPEPSCPEGEQKISGHCVDRPDRVVERGFTGGCPTGYVDHPSSPDLCALPLEAARLLRNATRN